MAHIGCPKCGARVEFDAGSKFVRCTYCASQIYIDRSGAGFYYIVPFMVDEANAVGIFKRWAAGPSKAKYLDQRAELGMVRRQYFPVYLFKRDLEGRELVKVEPAGSTTLPGLHSLKVPAGDLKVFDAAYDVQGVPLIQPDIEMAAYLDRLPGRPKEQALVFFPIWTVDYVHEGKRYEVVIDASSGEVFAADFPKRGSGAYMLVAAAGFVAFLGETLLLASNPIPAVALMGITLAGVFGASLFVARRM
ncbi:MAG: zinc ribbon domain-containing protein [Methanomassiliicoccales archaeon]|nr:zinc ribbon domain-containing protein [Methanomassiliicoccales archaeon]